MTNKKEALQQSQRAIGDYFKLSRLLFGEDAPNDVNEIPKDSEFYQTTRDIADDMKLDWENMSHTDSNRVMLNLLAEYFACIQPEEGYHPVLTISFQKD